MVKRIINNNGNMKYYLLWCTDVALVILSYIFALMIRFDFIMSVTYIENLLGILPLILLAHIGVSFFLGINKSLWSYVSIEESMRIALSVFFSTLIVVFVYSMFIKTGFPRSVFVLGGILSAFSLLAVRIIYRYYRIRSKQRYREFNALIVGAGEAGNLLQKEIQTNVDYDCKIVGFIDDDNYKIGKLINGTPILGGMNSLKEIVKDKDINEIFIAIPSADSSRIREIITACEKVKVPVKIMGINNRNLDERPQLRKVSIDDLLGRGEIKLDQKEIQSYLTNKTVMVTGGGGSIGSELVRQIVKFKPKLMIIFDCYENNMYSIQQEIIINKRKGLVDSSVEVLCLIGSVREKARVDKVLKEYHPDVVYHAAAHKHVPLVEDSPKEAIKNNVFGTHNVLTACIENKVSKFILISTDKAVNPTNVMGATKRMCELIIQSHRDNGVTKIGAVRFGNVLGSNGSVIPLFKKQIENGGPITVTHPDIIRYFMTIPEAAQLVLQAGVYANHGDIFVLDMGEPVKILKLAEDLISLSGLQPYKDIDIQFTGLRPGEKMYEELSLGNEERHKTENDLIYINEPMDIKLETVNKILDELNEIITNNSDEEVKLKILEVIK